MNHNAVSHKKYLSKHQKYQILPSQFPYEEYSWLCNPTIHPYNNTMPISYADYGWITAGWAGKEWNFTRFCLVRFPVHFVLSLLPPAGGRKERIMKEKLFPWREWQQDKLPICFKLLYLLRTLRWWGEMSEILILLLRSSCSNCLI